MERLSRTVIQLNLTTRGHHGAADAPWLDLMVPDVSTHRYLRLLVRVYGFEAPIEAALRYTPGISGLLDLRAYNRSGLLVQDLLRLGMSAARLADLPQRFTTFTSPADALGWMYVIERATLLHGGVRRYLVQRIPELAEATSYLSAYDGETGQRWNELGNALDMVADSPSVTHDIMRAANQAFRALCEWVRIDDSVQTAAS